MGDILISYGDFLENNAQLLPASYVEEIWALELFERIKEIKEIDNKSHGFKYNELVEFCLNPFTKIPSIEEALMISSQFNIPLHPKYSFYWESINLREFLFIRNALLSITEGNYSKQIIEISYNHDLKVYPRETRCIP